MNQEASSHHTDIYDGLQTAPSTDNRYAQVPAELKALPNWVCFKLIKVPGRKKPSKVPFHPSGELAKANDATTWSTYLACLNAVSNFDGIGFQFSPPYCGVDLDDCRNPETAKIDDWAMGVIEDVDSYTEVSPSGTGVHIIAKGKLPPGGCKVGKVEMYEWGRFFTFTGDTLEGRPTAINERIEALAEVHRVYLNKAESVQQPPVAVVPSRLTDDDIVARASANPKFRALWAGDWQSAYSTQSEADFALCSTLAFWTGNDVARMDSLFRQSGLMRDKWNREDYSKKTMTRVMCANPYDPNFAHRQTAPQSPPSVSRGSKSLSADELLDLLQAQPPETFQTNPQKYLVDKLVPARALILMSGKPGGGKSTLALSFCFEIANNDTPVLYLDTDNSISTAKERIVRFGGKTPKNFFYYGPWIRDAEDRPIEPPQVGSSQLAELVRKLGSPLVVIDTLRTHSDCDENDNTAVGNFFKELRKLVNLGATVLVIHHVGKDGSSSYRGASSMEGAVDVGLKVIATQKDGLIEKIEVEPFKSRFGDGKIIEYRMQAGIPVRHNPTSHETLMDIFKKNQGLTKDGFETVADGHGFKRVNVRRFINESIVARQIDYTKKKLWMKKAPHLVSTSTPGSSIDSALAEIDDTDEADESMSTAA
jgi:putative DNA primase/helicase